VREREFTGTEREFIKIDIPRGVSATVVGSEDAKWQGGGLERVFPTHTFHSAKGS
jgi:hypothetical protein